MTKKAAATATMRTSGALVAALLLALPDPASAVDGVVEINHARALAGGVTPGDSPGYPVTLTASGSYRLTSNLTPPDQNTNVIELGSTGDVVIDMNGFSILGTSVCTIGAGGYVSSCTNTGTGSGIVGSGFAIAIEHGLLQGLGNKGIAMSAAAGVAMTDLGITNCAGGGVEVGLYGLFRRVSVGFTGGTGISTGDASVLRESGASGNTTHGLVAGVAARVEGGQYATNGGDGVEVGGTSTIRRCRVVANGIHGIVLGSSSMLLDTMSSFNGGYGVDFGVAVGGSTTGYAQNVLSGNSLGDRNGAGGTQLGTNICGAVLCP